MIPRFDIFILENGEPRWLEAVENLEHAKSRLQLLQTVDLTNRFLVLDQKTGNKTILSAAEIHSTKPSALSQQTAT
jgi:hypothetical protein